MSFFPGTFDLSVYQGDTMSFTVTYKEGVSGSEVGVDLTGATLLSQIRTSASAASATTTFTVTPDADQTANPGKMVVTLPAANSALLDGSSYVYDIQVTWGHATVQTILRGSIAVTSEVTR